MWSRLLLLGIAVVAVTGNAVDFKTKLSSMKARSYLGCFKSVKRPKAMMEHLKDCVDQTNMDAIMKKIKETKEAPEITSIDDVVEETVACMQNKTKVLNEEGDLSLEKLLAYMDNLDGDQTKISVLKDIARDCFKNKVNGTGITAAKHDLRLSKCSLQEQYKYCQENDEEPGKLAMVVAMMTLQQKSKCDVVKVVDTLKQITKKCDGTKSPKTKKTGRPSGRRRRDISIDPNMKRTMLCVGEEMEYMDENTGIDFDQYAEVVGRFPGWESIPEIKVEVQTAVKSCKSEAGFKSLTTSEVIAKYPMLKDRSPLAVQFVQLIECLLPKFATICGMRNQLSLFLFPPLAVIYPKSIVDELTDGKVDLNKKVTQSLTDEEAVIVALETSGVDV